MSENARLGQARPQKQLAVKVLSYLLIVPNNLSVLYNIYCICLSTELVSLEDTKQEIEDILHSDETTKTGLSGNES